MTIKAMSYEECREDFFVKLIKHAENKIKHWKQQKGYRCEIEENLANAGAEISYCQDALKALEKQIPKKPIKDRYPWAICSVCGGSVYLKKVQEHIVNNETTYCEHCGQALDWGGE